VTGVVSSCYVIVSRVPLGLPWQWRWDWDDVVGRTVMQGAHFFLSQLWTLLFGWSICLGCYHLVLYRTAPASVSVAGAESMPS